MEAENGLIIKPSLEKVMLAKSINEKTAIMNQILNQDPPSSWLKNHPTLKIKNQKGERVPLRYMPIERTESLLTQLYGRYRVEVKDMLLLANSLSVSVRVHYWNVVFGEWDWTDGVGAAPIQTDEGHGATDFNAMKSSGVQMALPAAKSFAIKDATDHLGKLFGRDVNRQEQIAYNIPSSVEGLIHWRNKVSEIIDTLPDVDREAIINRIHDDESLGRHNTEYFLDLYNEINMKINGD